MESWVLRSHALQGRLRLLLQLLILLFQLRKNIALFWLTTKRLKWAFLYSKHYCGSKPVTTLKSTVPGSSQMLRICCNHSTENIDEWALSIHHFIYTQPNRASQWGFYRESCGNGRSCHEPGALLPAPPALPSAWQTPSQAPQMLTQKRSFPPPHSPDGSQGRSLPDRVTNPKCQPGSQLAWARQLPRAVAGDFSDGWRAKQSAARQEPSLTHDVYSFIWCWLLWEPLAWPLQKQSWQSW